MGRRFYDLLERSGWTFVQGFAAEWLITRTVDEQTLQVALVAGAAAVAKCIIATRIGSSNTAATLPLEDDTPRA